MCGAVCISSRPYAAEEMERGGRQYHGMGNQINHGWEYKVNDNMLSG
jgi:hypothetical protein